MCRFKVQTLIDKIISILAKSYGRLAQYSPAQTDLCTSSTSNDAVCAFAADSCSASVTMEMEVNLSPGTLLWDLTKEEQIRRGKSSLSVLAEHLSLFHIQTSKENLNFRGFFSPENGREWHKETASRIRSRWYNELQFNKWLSVVVQLLPSQEICSIMKLNKPTWE